MSDGICIAMRIPAGGDAMLRALESISIDWTNFDEASRVTQEIIQELADNRPLLRRMALAVDSSDALRSLSEKHGELNYIVLHDALDRGMRIRLHRFSKGQEDIPHNHRFSFSSVILHGSYVHTLFDLERSGTRASDNALWRMRQPPGTHGDVELEHLRVSGLSPLITTTQSAGSRYTLHHSTIHKTAMPVENAFSLFLRSPAQKPCALQLEPADQTYRWKFGREREDTAVLSSRRMTTLDYRQFIESLELENVI